MPSSLGICVENNIIKYAKVQKENNKFKIEAYGIKFYENFEETLRQIIKETYSFKNPISINISNELYNYFDVFSLLNKQDIKKAVDIEFEMLCNEKKYDKDSLETKYLLTPSLESQDKFKVLHVAANKNDLNKKVDILSEYKLGSMTPLPTSITNIVNKNEKNVAIINIEDETKITTIVNGEIYRVDVLEEGMGKILKDINDRENSWIKSYEICKNTTIYQEGTGVQTDDNEYLDVIMPVLYKIVQGCKKILDNIEANIEKVYITGTATAINNIDLYFQDFLTDMKCEILKPYFVESTSLKTSIKDYIEVNSAVALALESLGEGIPSLNFRGKRNISISSGNVTAGMKNEVTKPLDSGEKLLLRITATVILALILYVGFSKTIITQIENRQKEVDKLTTQTTSQISLMESDINSLESQATTYSKLKEQLTDSTNTDTTRFLKKDAIPILLDKIMAEIPARVQVTSIENTSSTHIVIQAQSDQYQQLGYFNTVITNKGILKDVKSTSGVKQDSMIKITIEGELP